MEGFSMTKPNYSTTPNEITDSHRNLAKNLTSHGYGKDEQTILDILKRIPEDELVALSYNLYRTAEKSGADAFDCTEIYSYE